MLEQMRRQGASIFVYLIFSLLIVIFVINFRPGQSRSDDNGCRGTSNAAITVDGVDADDNAFKAAYFALPAFMQEPPKNPTRTHIALDLLIGRELLAQAAEDRGLLVDEDLVRDAIKNGHFFFAGQTARIPGIFDENHLWNRRAFESWYHQQLNLSRDAYIDEQKRSMLATMMADILRESVVVSKDEALADYLFRNNTRAYDLVAFKPETYRGVMKLSDDDVARFAKDHGDAITAKLKTQPVLLLDQVFIPKAAMSADDAKAKLEQLVKGAGADQAKFLAAGKALAGAVPTATATTLGWHAADNARLADWSLGYQVKTLMPGQATPVLTTENGAYVLFAADKKLAADLKENVDQVKLEIADSLAKDAWSKEAAKRAAIAALDAARGKNLADLYEPESEPLENSADPLQQILNDPKLSPEDKQKLLQQLLQQQQPPQHGERAVESKDIPAGWFEDDSGAIGSAIAATGSAPTSPAPTSPAPTGSAMAGSAADAPVVASNDVLPAIEDVPKPGLRHVDATPRAPQLQGLEGSKAAATAVFDELRPGELAKRVYEIDGNYVVLQLREKNSPDVEKGFAPQADQYVAKLREERGQALLRGWLRSKCEALAKDGKIVPAVDKITERDDDGRALPTTSYRPCSAL